MATGAHDVATMKTLKPHIDTLIARHGSMRAAAEAIQVDVSTLSRLRSGERGEQIGEELLKRLGLERVVSFRRVKGRA